MRSARSGYHLMIILDCSDLRFDSSVVHDGRSVEVPFIVTSYPSDRAATIPLVASSRSASHALTIRYPSKKRSQVKTASLASILPLHLTAITLVTFSTMEDEYEQHFNEVPTSIDPYAVLGLDREVPQTKVKHAYHKAALRHHPDKAAADDKQAAHTKFQQIAFAYAILSDPRRRQIYDRTGRSEDSMDLDDEDFDWMAFYRAQYFETVTSEKIEKFSEEYKGSAEERGHVLQYYEQVEGDMRKLYRYVMLSDVLADEDRFQEIIKTAIRDGEVEDYPKFSAESEKHRQSRITDAMKKREREEKEAAKAKQELEQADAKSKKSRPAKKSAEPTADLAALIQSRQRDRAGRANDFFSRLEQKYGVEEEEEEDDDDDDDGDEDVEVTKKQKQKRGKKGVKRPVEEPPEELFEANRKRGKVSVDKTGGPKRKTGKVKD
nr:dnaj like subfamily c member 9 [Quercus suber]